MPTLKPAESLAAAELERFADGFEHPLDDNDNDDDKTTRNARFASIEATRSLRGTGPP